MKRKILMTILVVSLAFNAGILLVIGHRIAAVKKWKGGGGAPPVSNIQKWMVQRKLGLTKGQTKEIERISQETREKVSPLRKRVIEKKAELIRAVKEEKADLNKRKEILSDLSDSLVGIGEKVLEGFIEIRDRMNPEQKQKLDKIIEKQFNAEAK